MPAGFRRAGRAGRRCQIFPFRAPCARLHGGKGRTGARSSHGRTGMVPAAPQTPGECHVCVLHLDRPQVPHCRGCRPRHGRRPGSDHHPCRGRRRLAPQVWLGCRRRRRRWPGARRPGGPAPLLWRPALLRRAGLWRRLLRGSPPGPDGLRLAHGSAHRLRLTLPTGGDLPHRPDICSPPKRPCHPWRGRYAFVPLSGVGAWPAPDPLGLVWWTPWPGGTCRPARLP